MLELIFTALLVASFVTLFVKNGRVAAVISLIASLLPVAAIIDWGNEFGLKIFSFGLEKSMDFSIAGITMHFSVTALAWFFGVMIFFLIPPIMLFSYSFFEKNRGFFPFMLFLITAVFGILLASDFLTLFFFWELMAASSFILVYMGRDRKAIISYLSFSVLSAVLILTGIALIYSQNGTLLFSNVAFSADEVTVSAIILMIAGFAVKSALMPLHAWAPFVYSKADEPFVAFLSGGLSKMGYYGMFLMLFALPGAKILQQYFDSTVATYILALIGAISAFIGTLLAFMEDDLRKLLAYSSIAQLGYIAVGFGIGSSLAITGALFQAFNHAFFKSVLFLAAGAVAYRTGKWKISELGGVAYKMPFTFMAALFSIFALAAIPITSGFAAKWLLYEAAVSNKYIFITPIMLIASVGAFLYSFRILYGVFLGENRHDDIKEAPLPMVAGMFLLVMPLIIFLIFPGYMLDMMHSALVNAGIGTVSHTNYVISTGMASYNTIAVVVGMMIAMIPAFLIYVLRKHRNIDFKDNFLAGEPYEIYGHISMHAANNFYKPIEDVLMPYLRKGATSFYMALYNAMGRVSKTVRRIYTGLSQDYAIYVAVFLLIIMGWLIW
ncbi:MAG: NADH/ubiquinone/plastoquinone (complex I) [Thermoplasmata archaeon]|jgi:NADH-quinone oxidoreductase subunit M|nr:MAG: NADH/ubiquinone/plastoquinone (complex I) [Thermoplasmata archaeon]